MSASRATRGSPASRSRGEAASRAGRAHKLDRRLVSIAAVIAVGSVALVWCLLPLPLHSSWQAYLAASLVVLIAALGRALLGAEDQASHDAPKPPLGRALGAYLPLLALATLPYLHSLSVGLLSDDLGMLWAARASPGLGDALNARPLPAFYRPLPMLLWWAGLRLWAGAPAGYHVANLLLHAVNSLLVFSLARRLIPSRYGALMAGGLFAVHPLHVEPTVWACCNSDLLCLCFSLLSLLSLEAYLTAPSVARRRLPLAGSLVGLCLALVSKEAAMALPGVVVLRLVLTQKAGRWPRLASVGGLQALVLASYLVWRMHKVGGLGGYPVPLNLWNTVVPTSLLRHVVAFFFPLNRTLVGGRGTEWVYLPALVGMAGGLVWWIRHLSCVPAWRLWYWFGLVVLLTTPAWAFGGPTWELEHSRYSLLPTLGLFLLFGDLCAGTGPGWRRSGLVAASTVLVALALTAWYVFPWREAHRRTERAIAAGDALLGKLERGQHSLELYVQGLPESYQGAQVLRNGFQHALSLRRGRWVHVQMVGREAGVPPEVMAQSVLLPGDYLVRWQTRPGQFVVVRSGEMER